MTTITYETNEQGEQVKVTTYPSGAVTRELDRQPAGQSEIAAWPAFDFYRRFTSAERIRARALASVDPVADDIMRTLDAAIASGSNVRADDPDTINGLNYLSAYGPADGNGPVLAAGRAAEILA